jgi:thiol-disulfide isomerase/thioredoxin
MKTKTLSLLLPAALGLAVAGACATLVYAHAQAALTCSDGEPGAPTMIPASLDPAPAEKNAPPRRNLKSLAGKLEFLGDKPALAGRPLLLEFWATWCPPCRGSIAHLNSLYKEYNNRGLEIIGVTSENKTEVERFRARTLMNYSVALDPDQALAAEFQVQAIPQAWLFDKDGRVVWSGHPMELDEQTIARVLPTHPAHLNDVT